MFNPSSNYSSSNYSSNSYQEELDYEIQKFQKQYQQQPSQYISQSPQSFQYQQNNNNKSEMDLEYRDTINDKVSNMKLSLPTQQKAQHILDMNMINNNPQFQSQLNIKKENSDFINYTRKDNRDGMNNKMDSLMFQRFDNPEIPNTVRVNESYTHQQQQQQFLSQSLSQPYKMDKQNQQNQQNHIKFNDRDLQNERMQNITSLPRALYQPTKSDNNPHLSAYQNSYENQYKSYDSTIPISNISIKHPESQYINNINPLVNHYIPNTNESARVNYKDMHNERMQGLTPLARTCAIPNSDYMKSIQQNNMLIDSEKQNINNNYQKTRKYNNNMNQNQTSNWYMTNNINPVGPPPKVIIQDNRPVDTRQYI